MTNTARPRERTNMTPEQLKNFIHVRAELERLNTEIAEMSADLETLTRVQDTVQASGRNWPYIMHTVSVEGLTDAVSKDARKLQTEIAKRKAGRLALRGDYARAYDEMQRFFCELGDTELKRMLEYRYIERLTWIQTAERMNRDARLRGVYTEAGCRMRCKRFFCCKNDKADCVKR